MFIFADEKYICKHNRCKNSKYFQTWLFISCHQMTAAINAETYRSRCLAILRKFICYIIIIPFIPKQTNYPNVFKVCDFWSILNKRVFEKTGKQYSIQLKQFLKKLTQQSLKWCLVKFLTNYKKLRKRDYFLFENNCIFLVL